MGINIEPSLASKLVTLMYARRVLKIFQMLSEMFDDPGENEQAQKEHDEKVMTVITSLAQTVSQFASKQEHDDES